MKPKRLSELRALIQSAEFAAWWQSLLEARAAIGATEAHYEELLAQATLIDFRAELSQKNAIDTLYRAGEHEDTAAAMLAEATDLENKSFRGVSDFEEQRYRASEAWYRLGAAEKSLEEAKDAKRHPAEIQTLERALRSSAEDYDKENSRKARLWDEVERLWSRSAEVSLLVAEQRAQGKKVRSQAEKLFGTAEERKQKGKALRAETDAAAKAMEAAKAKASALLEQARVSFGCSSGVDFLYFRHKDDQRLAWAVALVDDRESYNVEVQPLHLYQVDRARGVGFLEPARTAPPNLEEADRRFEQYFLQGRKGQGAPGAA